MLVIYFSRNLLKYADETVMGGKKMLHSMKIGECLSVHASQKLFKMSSGVVVPKI